MRRCANFDLNLWICDYCRVLGKNLLIAKVLGFPALRAKICNFDFSSHSYDY